MSTRENPSRDRSLSVGTLVSFDNDQPLCYTGDKILFPADVVRGWPASKIREADWVGFYLEGICTRFYWQDRGEKWDVVRPGRAPVANRLAVTACIVCFGAAFANVLSTVMANIGVDGWGRGFFLGLVAAGLLVVANARHGSPR